MSRHGPVVNDVDHKPSAVHFSLHRVRPDLFPELYLLPVHLVGVLGHLQRHDLQVQLQRLSGESALHKEMMINVHNIDDDLQLRLDFNSFTITGPSSGTTTIGKTLNGNLVNSAKTGKSVTASSQCLTDTFTVTNPGGSSPPTICGTNTGSHSKS